MVTEISREELKLKLEHPKKTVLLETLAPEDFRNAHLPGALNMPPDQVRTLAAELIPKKDVRSQLLGTCPERREGREPMSTCGR